MTTTTTHELIVLYDYDMRRLTVRRGYQRVAWTHGGTIRVCTTPSGRLKPGAREGAEVLRGILDGINSLGGFMRGVIR